MKSIKYKIWGKVWILTNPHLVYSETVKDLIRDQAWSTTNEWLRRGIGAEILRQAQE